MWQELKKKIVAILQANSLLQTVYDYEATEFTSDPVATVVPSADEGDYRTTTANRRVYAFNIMLWVKRSGTSRNDETAEDVLTDLVDSVIDQFDKYYTLTGSPGAALVLPTGYTMVMVEAAPSQWFYSDRETLYRGAQITLRVHMDVDITLIGN